MKNTGIVLSIIIALVIILTGGYFLWQKGVKPTTQTSQDTSLQETTTDQGESNDTEVETATGSSEAEEETPGTGSNIDTDLKNLDTEINAAFQKDADGDPTSGI